MKITHPKSQLLSVGELRLERKQSPQCLVVLGHASSPTVKTNTEMHEKCTCCK